MLRVLATATLLAVTGTAFAAAQQTVFLRERVVVEGSMVTLGDLFDGIEGEAAGIALARAPQPGSRTFLDPAWVSRQAERNGLEWANATSIERVAVERAAQSISAGEIADLIAAHMYAETGRSHEVTLSNRMLSLHAPLDAFGSPEIVRLELDGASGPFRAMIRTHDEGEPVSVTGRADPMIDMPVLARPLARGEVITAGDVEWVRMRADRVRADAISSETALIGQEARRALRAGEALRGYDLREPAAVTRGETVALVFQSGALVLTARARALENAALGQTARFVNLQSNRTVEGVVEGPGRVRVTGATSHVF